MLKYDTKMKVRELRQKEKEEYDKELRLEIIKNINSMDRNILNEIKGILEAINNSKEILSEVSNLCYDRYGVGKLISELNRNILSQLGTGDSSENKINLRDKIKTEVAISLKSDEILYAMLSKKQKIEVLNTYEDLLHFVDKYREYVLLYFGDKEYCDSPFTFVKIIFDVE